MDPRNEGHTICFSVNLVGGGAVFFQLLKSDFFLNKVKAFIFVTIKSYFTIAIGPYASYPQFHPVSIYLISILQSFTKISLITIERARM